MMDWHKIADERAAYICSLESDLATAEQDSRQKQARIERLEKAVKELREGLKIIAGYRQCADNLLSNLDIARATLKSTEDI